MPSETQTPSPKRGRRGEGGGRPRRPGEKVRLSLDVSPEAAALLRVEALRTGRPLWEVIEKLAKAGLPGAQDAAPAPSAWLLTNAPAPAPPPALPADEHLARLVCKAFLPHVSPEKALETARAMAVVHPPIPRPS